jgi:phosphatidylinositol 4-kinase
MTLEKQFPSFGELRDTLRRAAALLCRAKLDHCAIVHYLVSVPFIIFTNQSIKLGISLWLGVINENPRLESAVMAEIAQNWEMTVRNRIGAFSERLQ